MAALAQVDDAVLHLRAIDGGIGEVLAVRADEPEGEGMCMRRLRLSEGVGGTDCSISSTSRPVAASWVVATVTFGVPA